MKQTTDIPHVKMCLSRCVSCLPLKVFLPPLQDGEISSQVLQPPVAVIPIMSPLQHFLTLGLQPSFDINIPESGLLQFDMCNMWVPAWSMLWLPILPSAPYRPVPLNPALSTSSCYHLDIHCQFYFGYVIRDTGYLHVLFSESQGLCYKTDDRNFTSSRVRNTSKRLIAQCIAKQDGGTSVALALPRSSLLSTIFTWDLPGALPQAAQFQEVLHIVS